MHELIIEPDRVEREYWRDLWRYRELFYFLAWRDLLVRYKQTAAGLSWSLIRPLLTMLVLTLVFGKWGKMPADGVAYPILVLCGTLPWQFFATAVSESGNSLVTNSNLITKVYFPRIVMPASTIITGCVDFAVSALILAGIMVYYGYVPPPTIWLLPLVMLPLIALSLGAGLWISALMVEYRDFRFIVPFVVQFGLYISPVGFSSNVVPADYRFVYGLNPMVGIIDSFRWCLIGGSSGTYWPAVAASLVGVLVIFAGGLWYFRRTELMFADVI